MTRAKLLALVVSGVALATKPRGGQGSCLTDVTTL